jgi:hypothetical protein
MTNEDIIFAFGIMGGIFLVLVVAWWMTHDRHK